MERFKELDGYQKFLLVVMAIMVLVFTILYPVTISRVGFAYKDAILVQSREGDNTVYTGKIYGVSSRFTVTPDKTVEFQYGEKEYGPYSIRVDSSAAPKGADIPEDIVGLELLRGDEVIFRGGVVDLEDICLVYNEDGSMESGVGIDMGTYVDGEGAVMSLEEPSVSTILSLLEGPKLTHPGTWWAWVVGVVFCVATAVSMLFADELFYFQLSLSIENAENAEPTELEIFGRYVAWTILPILALVIFIVGLQ